MIKSILEKVLIPLKDIDVLTTIFEVMSFISEDFITTMHQLPSCPVCNHKDPLTWLFEGDPCLMHTYMLWYKENVQDENTTKTRDIGGCKWFPSSNKSSLFSKAPLCVMRLSSLCRQGWVKMRKNLFSCYLVKYISLPLFLYYPPAPFWGSSGAGRRRHWNGVTMAYLLHFSVPPYLKEWNKRTWKFHR